MLSHILLPTFQTDSLRDINIHYLYYLINIRLNWWSRSDHHTVMLKYCACNNITFPCGLWCFCEINWKQSFQRILFLQHKHPADIWAALNGSFCAFEWVLLYFLLWLAGIFSSICWFCTAEIQKMLYRKKIWCKTGKIKQINCYSWWSQWCLYQITVPYWDVCVFIEVFYDGQSYREQINWADY